jgi:uncharacterized protein DUF3800
MLQAFMDESGTHEDAVICVFGGFIAVEKNWRIFETKWRRHLIEHGVTDEKGRPDFHARDFYGKKSVFRGWTNAHTAKFERRLVEIVVDSRLVPVASGIHTGDFNSYSVDDRRFLTGGELNPEGSKWIKSGKPTSPYFLLFQDCLLKAARRSRSKIHYVLDQQKQYEGWAKQLYGFLREESDVKNRFGSQIFSPRQEALGVQAADLLLYHVFKYREETAELSASGIRAYGRPILAGLIGRHSSNLRLWTKSGTDQVLQRYKRRKGL